MARIALIGLGASGLYFLQGAQSKEHSITIYDVGEYFGKRKPCPIDVGKLSRCPILPCWPNCTVSDAGGIWNDLKVLLTASPVIGGRLVELVGKEIVQGKMDYIKKVILSNSPVAIPEVHPNKDDLDWLLPKAKGANLHFQYQALLHCGSDNAVAINTNILDNINKENMEFKWRRQVVSVTRSNGKFIVKSTVYRPLKWEKVVEETAEFDKVVISVGRSGTKWLSEQEFHKDLQVEPGQVDIGVRVETLKKFTEEMDRRFYEPKMYLYSKRHNDPVRNFCSNPGGYVTPENHGDYVLVNGYSKMYEKSENNNFAVLVSKKFTLPFKNPQLYCQHLAKMVNMLAGGGPLVQRLGDLKKGRRTKSLASNTVTPTLEAEPGDISLAYPHRILEGILEYLEALDIISPGISSDDTLLYGCEAKTYPDFIPVDKNMQTKIPNLYIIGDASSWTRGLSMAASSGLLAAEGI